jgi:hypothetical protein
VLAPCVAAAQDGRVKITNVTLGFDGVCRVGSWTPVRVTLHSKTDAFTGHLELVVPDGDGVPSRVTTRGLGPVLVPAGGTRTTTLYVRFGRMHEEIGVTFRVDDEVVARDKFQTGIEDAKRSILSSGRELIVAVGYPCGLKEAIELRDQDEYDEDATVVAQLSSTDQLPTRWYGYEGVDFVVLATGNLDAYRNLTADSAQAAALEEWVRRGGRLVLCVGKNAPTVLRADHALSRFAPGSFSNADMATLRDVNEIEDYSEDLENPVAVGDEGLRLLAPRLRDVDGYVEVKREPDLPLVIRSAYGFGEVVFVAVDLDLAPFSRWAGRGRVVNRLLGFDTADEIEELNERYNYGRRYGDHAGQLRSALDNFEGIRLVPFSVVAALILLYVILIGPVDYFVLKKYFKRMEFTWITFPIIVLVFSFGAYGLAYWLKGSQIRINQIDLVDVDVETGSVRGVTWVNLFSPRTDGYDFSVQPQSLEGGAAQDPQVLFSWLGLPGDALGGMNPSSGGMSFFDAYDFSPQLDRVQNMPVAVWSTKSLTARWQYELGDAPPFDATLQVKQLGLRGKITSRLDFSLEDCVVLHSGVAYVVGDIEPGETFVLDSSVRDPAAKDYWKTKISGAIGSHNDDRLEPEHIVRAMMFHRLVEGQKSTLLLSRYQAFVDLSGHVEHAETNRAILVGRGADNSADDGAAKGIGARLVDGETALGNDNDEHTTIYRFVFRVEDE